MKIEIVIPDSNIKNCKHCNEPFIAARKDKKYCSHSCRQQAYVLRQAFALNKSMRQTEANDPQKKDGFIKRFIKLLW